jgi:hypothetical protein
MSRAGLQAAKETLEELLRAVNRNEMPTVPAPISMGLSENASLYLDMRLEQVLDDVEDALKELPQ